MACCDTLCLHHAEMMKLQNLMMKLQNLRRSWLPDLVNGLEEKQIPVIKYSRTLRVGGITQNFDPYGR